MMMRKNRVFRRKIARKMIRDNGRVKAVEKAQKALTAATQSTDSRMVAFWSDIVNHLESIKRGDQ